MMLASDTPTGAGLLIVGLMVVAFLAVVLGLTILLFRAVLRRMRR